ncbi:MAG: hypothetical protein ABI165_09670 [Bryobacteraceae bacterium]
MNPHEIMTGILTGCVLVVFGSVPGLFSNLVEAVRNFSHSISSGLPLSLPHHPEYTKVRRPIWLAWLGAALIVLSILAYLSN